MATQALRHRWSDDQLPADLAPQNALVSIAFGVVLFAHPGAGALTLALLFGLFNLIYGGWALAQGIELRHTRHAVQSAARVPHAA